MARRFTRTRSGLVVRLDDDERDVLRGLFLDVAELLRDDRPDAGPRDPLEEMVGITEGASLPDDPALARLLPDASQDDDELTAEFRRLTERGLRQRKQGALTTAVATLERTAPAGERAGSLVLDDAEAQAWLTALNDVRLVIAERMGLRTDEDAERLGLLGAGTGPGSGADDGPLAWMVSVYDFLSWLLETLVTALTAPVRGGGRAAGPTGGAR